MVKNPAHTSGISTVIPMAGLTISGMVAVKLTPPGLTAVKNRIRWPPCISTPSMPRRPGTGQNRPASCMTRKPGHRHSDISALHRPGMITLTCRKRAFRPRGAYILTTVRGWLFRCTTRTGRSVRFRRLTRKVTSGWQKMRKKPVTSLSSAVR